MDLDSAERMRRVVVKLTRRFNAASTAAGLSPTEASVLGVAARRGPIGIPAIVAAEGLNPTMLSRILNRLEKLGLAERGAVPGDLRVVQVTATAAGQEVHRRIREERAASVAGLLADLDEADRRRLDDSFELLEHLIDSE
ncbi:MAG: MarR family transcriptional regulator [Nocardioides sp.]|uniref:MarR family winged helix-turn-helix transcriptional regulator n=1 Tax=Nocardioides sp. TaxID=35761 RepID=UPI0039E6539E